MTQMHWWNHHNVMYVYDMTMTIFCMSYDFMTQLHNTWNALVLDFVICFIRTNH